MIISNKTKKMTKAENLLTQYARALKEKNRFSIFFDEFQVTNIVDAMILGKLFESLFDEKIFILITSNIKINDLYKDGLQREQFLPFLKAIKEKIHEYEYLKATLILENKMSQKLIVSFTQMIKKPYQVLINYLENLQRIERNFKKKLLLEEESFHLNNFMMV